MNMITILQLCLAVSICTNAICVGMWLAAERELNRYISEYYRTPRITPFPTQPRGLRRTLLQSFRLRAKETPLRIRKSSAQ